MLPPFIFGGGVGGGIKLLSKQDISITMSGSAQNNNVYPSRIPKERALVVLNGYSGGANGANEQFNICRPMYDADDLYRLYVFRHKGSGAHNVTVFMQLLEIVGQKSLNYYFAMNNIGNPEDVTISAVDISKSVIIPLRAWDGNRRNTVGLEFINSTTVRVHHDNHGPNTAFYVLEFA